MEPRTQSQISDHRAEADIGQSRACGQCNVCCTALSVSALNKPAGQSCRHLTPSGCGVYERRYPICRGFICMWLADRKGVLADAHRPDQLGLIFTASKPDGGSGRQVIRAHEVWPGASGEPESRRVITYLQQFAPVQVVAARTPTVTPTELTFQGRPLSAAA